MRAALSEKNLCSQKNRDKKGAKILFEAVKNAGKALSKAGKGAFIASAARMKRKSFRLLWGRSGKTIKNGERGCESG